MLKPCCQPDYLEAEWGHKLGLLCGRGAFKYLELVPISRLCRRRSELRDPNACWVLELVSVTALFTFLALRPRLAESSCSAWKSRTAAASPSSLSLFFAVPDRGRPPPLGKASSCAIVTRYVFLQLFFFLFLSIRPAAGPKNGRVGSYNSLKGDSTRLPCHLSGAPADVHIVSGPSRWRGSPEDEGRTIPALAWSNQSSGQATPPLGLGSRRSFCGPACEHPGWRERWSRRH